jgi:hypothetical protein
MAVGWEGGGVTSAKGDGRTRKVERVLVSIDDQLYDIGIGEKFRIIKRASCSDHGDVAVLAQFSCEGVNQLRLK